MPRRSVGTSLLVAFLVSALVRGTPSASAAPAPAGRVRIGAAPRLAVVIAPLDARAKSQLGALEHAAEGAALATGRFELVQSTAAWEPTAANDRRYNLAQIDRLLRDGRKQLDELETAGAIRQFTEALALAQRVDLTRDFDLLVEVSTMLAAAHAVSGDAAQAKAELERLYTIAPRPKLSSSFFSPELLKYADAQRRMVGAARGKLTVRTDPTGARVWVDGTFRGLSPVSVDGMAGGKHFIATELQGYQLDVSTALPGEELVRLKPAESAPKLAAQLDRIAADPDGPGRDRSAQELASIAGAEQTLLVIAKKSTVGDRFDFTLVRVDARDGHNYGYRTVTGLPAELDELLKPILVEDVGRDGSEPVSHFSGSGAAGGPRKTFGYALLGVGALTLASGIYCGVQALGAANQYRLTPQIEAVVSADLASRGRTFSVLADVSFIVSAAALVAGVLLSFTKVGASRAVAAEPQAPPRIADDATDASAADQKAQAELQQALDEQRRAEEAKRKADDELRSAEEVERRADQRDAEEDAKRQRRPDRRKRR